MPRRRRPCLLPLVGLLTVLTLMSGALASCAGIFRDKELNKVAEIIDAAPDSAYRMLQAVDTTLLAEYDRMRYVYLHTRACDKLRLPISWPGEMQEAADYIDATGSDEAEKADAHYYAGIAHKKNRAFASAVASFLKSLEYKSDTRTRAFTYSNLRYCYAEQRLYEEAIVAAKQAAAAFHEVNSRRSESFAYRKIGDHYAEMEHSNVDSAKHYLHKCIEMARAIPDSSEIAESLSAIAQIQAFTGHLQEAFAYSDSSLRMCPAGADSMHLLFSRALVFAKALQRDSAVYYFRRSNPDRYSLSGKYGIYTELWKMEDALGNTEMKAFYSDSIIHYRQLMERNDEHLDIKNLVASHERRLLMQQHREERTRMINFYTITIVLFLVVVLYVLNDRMWLSLRIHEQKNDIKLRILDLKESISSLPEEPTLPAQLREKRAEQLHLCHKGFNATNAARQLTVLKGKMHPASDPPAGREAEQPAAKGLPSVRQQIADAIAGAYADIYQDMLSGYAGRLKQADCLLCILSSMGCSTDVCAAVLGSSPEATRRRRSRIYQVISAEDMALFFPKNAMKNA